MCNASMDGLKHLVWCMASANATTEEENAIATANEIVMP